MWNWSIKLQYNGAITSDIFKYIVTTFFLNLSFGYLLALFAAKINILNKIPTFWFYLSNKQTNLTLFTRFPMTFTGHSTAAEHQANCLSNCIFSHATLFSKNVFHTDLAGSHLVWTYACGLFKEPVKVSFASLSIKHLKLSWFSSNATDVRWYSWTKKPTWNDLNR